MDRAPMAGRILLEQTEIESVVRVFREAARFVMPALQDVQRVSGEEGSAW